MTDPRIASFADELLDRAAEFSGRVPVSTRRVRLGRAAVHVTVPAEDPRPFPDILGGLVPTTDPSPQNADFHLTVIDDRLGSCLPVGTWPSDYHFPLGVVRPDRSLPYRVSIDRHTSTVSAFDPRTRRIAVWIRDFGALPYWAAATPFRLQMSWIADTFDGEFVHAAAIARDDDALLLAGPSGSGKSTMSLLAAQSGFDLISDDFVLCDGLRAHSVYTRAKLHDKGMRTPGASGFVVVNPDAPAEKRIIDLESSHAISTAASATVRAMTLPVIAGMSAHQQITAGRALSMMAPASVSGLLGGTERSLPRLRALAQAVPCYRWALSGNFADDIGQLDRIWETVRAP